jgi:hypothetical protein
MNVTLALLLSAAIPAQTVPLTNLDFASGQLAHWEGAGFDVTPVGTGKARTFTVTSSDRDKPGRTGLLHRTFLVPRGAVVIRFTAAAVRAPGRAPEGALDVLLEAPGRVIIPRQVRTDEGWQEAPQLLPPRDGRLREYAWPVSAYAGQRVRIALMDADGRPGCHVVCGGFRVLSADDLNGEAFAAHMLRLEAEHHLPPMARLDSKHFMAIGNTPEGYTEHRLYNCETIYTVFFNHFTRKGFPVRRPATKMMVAIFDSQSGFEAYLGRTTSTTLTGIYHTPSNRLVVYDYGQNRAFLAGKDRGEQQVRAVPSALVRQHAVAAFSRAARTVRDDANIGTIMHEVAHQLSFNCGLLNRTGDVPVWLAEGLACYCEATTSGGWQGIGEPNPMRAAALAGPARGQGAFIPLRALAGGDDWLRATTQTDQVLLGYSQSWALFRMLMEERPQALRTYLALIHDRRTPDHRLADFGEAFGADLNKFEKRYHDYMKQVVGQQVRPRK